MLPTFISRNYFEAGRAIAATPSIRLAIGMVTLLSLAGCSIGPRYQRPQAPVPTQFKESVAAASPAATPSIAYNNWWLVFNDPTLDQLEKDVDSANQDIRIAVARVDQAEARARGSRTFLFPQL